MCRRYYGVVLEELKGDSSLVENVFPITLRTTITCNTCFCSSIKEDKSDILILPTFNQISSSLNESLKPETLSGEHMWSCSQCSELRESTRETSVSNCGQVLIIQLNRFTKFNGDTFKDTRFVECLPVKDHILTVPLKLDDNVSFSKEFSLVATINHSGSLNAGHYWAFIKDNMKVVNITEVMIKLQFKLPQALISRGFTRRTVFHAPALQQKGINRLMDIYQIWKPKL